MLYKDRKLSDKYNVALRVALMYLAFGAAWILFSDHILVTAFQNSELISTAQSIKGIVFVLLTSFLIFALIQRALIRIRKDIEARKKAEELVNLKNKQLQTLNRISREINAVLEVPVIMRKLVNAAIEMTGAEGGTAGVLKTGIMEFVEYIQQQQILNINYKFAPGYGVPGWVMQNRKPYLSNDAENDPQVIPEIRKTIGFYNLLDVPVLDRNGNLLGCFEVHNKKNQFTQEDVDILEGLASTASIAFENARIIEEHKRIRQQLFESEEKFRTAVTRAPFPIMIHASDGEIIAINDEWTNITGYSHDDIPTITKWIEKGFSMDSEAVMEVVSQIYSLKEKHEEGEYQINTCTGEKRIWNFTSTPLGKLPDGRNLVLSIAIDLTDSKNAEKKLIKHQQEQLEIFDTVPALIFFKDKDNRFIWLNSIAAKWFGFEPEILMNRNLYEVFPPEQADVFYNSDMEVFRTGKPVKDIVELINTNSGPKWIKVDKIPYRDENDNIKGVIGVASDITALKQTEDELIRARNAALEADRLKTDFLAQMSHEIRNPINIMLNMISLVKEEFPKPFNEDVEFCFSGIDSSSRRLIRTIDLILNMSEIQSGRYDCNYQLIDLEKDILANILHEFSTAAHLKGLKLTFSYDNSVPRITGDSYTLGQIFINLIENAIKYTPEGEINVRLYSNGNNSVIVDVCDTGIGISEEFLDKLFTPFSQEETGYSRKFEGNGLGLALVKRYCELNNARIHVSSRKSEGSVFTITFYHNGMMNS